MSLRYCRNILKHYFFFIRWVVNFRKENIGKIVCANVIINIDY